MNIVDWSKAPEWATCVVYDPCENFFAWTASFRNGSKTQHVDGFVPGVMNDFKKWVLVEKRPVIQEPYQPQSLADLHLAQLFTPCAKPSTAPELLNQASQLLAERGKQYDTSGEERSAAKIVAAFNAITGRDLTPGEGWLFLMMLKAVRFYSNTETPHRDSLEDLIAYSAIHAEEYLNESNSEHNP